MNVSQNLKQAKTKQAQLFSNTIVEKLTRTHIAVPVMLFIAISTMLFYWSTVHTDLALSSIVWSFLIGLILFTWVEYNIHRYVFHISTSTPLRKKIQFIIHGIHHEFPKDKERLAMPPLLSLFIAYMLLSLSKLIIGDFCYSFMAGFIIGYVIYISVHYIVHAFAPPHTIFKVLWINHAIHHYKNSNIAFGVSSPLWDYIYGTLNVKSK